MYEKYYQITAKPFQLTPDPKFFYASAKHKQALSYLQYGLEQGEGFIVITGPVGTGKTTLARNLLQQIENTNVQAIKIVTSCLSPEGLLSVIVNEFKLSPKNQSKAELLNCIETHLRYLSEHNKRALLLVDEAQNLPSDTVEELRMLSNFQFDNKPLLQSFLLGQEELKAIVQSPEMEQFRQRVIASCHLKPLSLEETAGYIEHRLTLVEMPNPKIFDDKGLHLIQQKTLGVPRKINLFIDRILLYGFLNELKTFSESDVQMVIEEMADELSSALQTSEKHFEGSTEIENVTSQDKAGLAHIQKSIAEMDEFLQENIEQKIKMSRYLDKLIKQKNINNIDNNNE